MVLPLIAIPAAAERWALGSDLSMRHRGAPPPDPLLRARGRRRCGRTLLWWKCFGARASPRSPAERFPLEQRWTRGYAADRGAGRWRDLLGVARAPKACAGRAWELRRSVGTGKPTAPFEAEKQATRKLDRRGREFLPLSWCLLAWN